MNTLAEPAFDLGVLRIPYQKTGDEHGQNEHCDDIGCKVFKASHPVPSEEGLLASRELIKKVSDEVFVYPFL